MHYFYLKDTLWWYFGIQLPQPAFSIIHHNKHINLYMEVKVTSRSPFTSTAKVHVNIRTYLGDSPIYAQHGFTIPSFMLLLVSSALFGPTIGCWWHYGWLGGGLLSFVWHHSSACQFDPEEGVPPSPPSSGGTAVHFDSNANIAYLHRSI